MLEVKKIRAEDSDLILSWRNHPDVYKYALNPNPIDKADHDKWFDKKRNDVSCFFYMASFNGIPCGTIRYDLMNNVEEAEVSISLSPEFWGKGLGTQMLLESEKIFKKESTVKKIHATVLNENTASMKLFEKTFYKKEVTKFIKTIS